MEMVHAEHAILRLQEVDRAILMEHYLKTRLTMLLIPEQPSQL
jgi:hypothetical protein